MSATIKRTTSRVPGVNWFTELQDTFGGKLLFMLFCTNHLVKGYNYMMLNAVFQFYFQDMSLPGPQIDRFKTIAFMPWAMKPLLGIVSDAFPILGFKKMPYLLFMSVLGCVGLGVASFAPLGSISPTLVSICLFVANAQWMSCDLMAEATYSRRMADHPAQGPSLLSFVWGGNQALSVVASALSGVIISGLDNVWGLRGAQWALATCFVPSIIVIFPTALNFLGEVKTTAEESRKTRRHLFVDQRMVAMVSIFVGLTSLVYTILGLFLGDTANFILIWIVVFVTTGSAFFVLRPVIGRLVVFNAISSCTMLAVGGAGQYFFTDTPDKYPEGPHFSPEFYASVLNTIGTLCAVVAIFIFNKFMSNWRYRTVFFSMAIFATVMQLMNPIVYSRLNKKIGIPDQVFMVGDTALTTASGLLYQLPSFLILSHMCPKNMEATMFALLAALSNFCLNTTYSISGFVCEIFGVTPDGSLNESAKFDNIWIVSIILTLLKLVPIAFLWLLPNVRMTEKVMEEGDDTSATCNSPYERCVGKAILHPSEEEKEPVDPSLRN